MGSSASKAAQASTRKYPGRPGNLKPPSPSQPAQPPHPPSARREPPRTNPSSSGRGTAPKSSMAKGDAIRANSINPDPLTNLAFSERLRQMGAVQPNPTLSNSSTAGGQNPSRSSLNPAYPHPGQNTTLSALEARRRLQEQADAEVNSMHRSGHPGREFLDVGTIREILVLRSRGSKPAEIETMLRLKPGVVQRLGPPGMINAVGGAAG